jgi:hypothetical protein
MMKRPRMHAEARAYDAETYANWGVRVRPRRKPGGLPDAYDDIHRTDLTDQGWKRHRGTQYREVPSYR